MNTNDIERGLKTEISRQVGQKNYQAEVAQFNQNCLVNAWSMSYKAGVRAELEQQIWEYVSLTMGAMWWSGKSNRVGVLTTIDDYTTKTGNITKAHYTANKKYYGSVKMYGTAPVAYDGHFRITKEKFDIDLSLLPTICKGLKEPCDFVKLFTPKAEFNIQAPNPVPEIPVAVPKKVVKTKPKVVVEYDSDDEPIGDKLKRQNAVRK